MTQHTPDETDRPDPTGASSLGWPDATAPLPQAGTRSLPQASVPAGPQPTPFRVEPSTPVPDDAVEADEAPSPGLAQLPPPQWTPAGDPTGAAPQTYAGPGVTVRRGPRPGTVMFGLLAMIVSAYVLLANLTDADLSLRLVGPPLVGAFGGVLLLVGLAGLVAGRLRR